MKKTTGMDRAVTAQWRPATRAVRGGTWRSEHGETSEALFLSSGYTYDDAQTVADRFAGTAQGMTYSRLQNPTVAMLEERIAMMDGAEACRVQATGMAAMTTALLCQLSAGDHVVAGRAAFGSCRWLVDQLLGNFGLAAVSQVQMLRNIILHHHELVDGSGYPDGLIAEQIPLESRIVTVADVFDALTSERPYKQPWPNAEAFAFLRQQAGLKFDRDCVMALLEQAEDIEHIQQCFRENAYG